ncbi:DgyrCDS8798 [Dimorphilus gyrociliatus]|nr:DgyrCDS8798 [Dimorphilus gyrociliatus]
MPKDGNSNGKHFLIGHSPKPSNDDDAALVDETNPEDINVPQSYRGPRLSVPLNLNQVHSLINAFKKKQQLHAKYVLLVLHEARKILIKRPTVQHASTAISKQITICGDLHGKIDDLFIVFYKNNPPAVDNPYVFNGDFVDRGQYSVEISVLLFAFLVIFPNEIYINRGNHEDNIVNMRYGFIKEIMNKYKEHATKIIQLFSDVFSWLPLATVIDDKVLVAHGGISDRTDLEYLANIDRHKYISALRPPTYSGGQYDPRAGDSDIDEQVDVKEWRQILDILWSDPRPNMGCAPNAFRGGGVYWGPDITKMILEKHDMELLIRSHECKPEGYEFAHGNKVLTIFSASNYYEEGSNKGAYIKMGTNHKPELFQFTSGKAHAGRKLTTRQRLSHIEESALQDLKSTILAHKSELLTAFVKHDPLNTGMLEAGIWCDCMNTVLEMELPWRSLRHSLVKHAEGGQVLYNTAFEELSIKNTKLASGETNTMTEMLYRNRDNLELIFRMMDKDNSGSISMQEFAEACEILSRHTDGSLSKESILDLGKSIDINKDGHIDFNEFLEAFRIVDMEGRSFGKSSPARSRSGSMLSGQ